MMETSCNHVNFLPELNTPKGTLHRFPFKMWSYLKILNIQSVFFLFVCFFLFFLFVNHLLILWWFCLNYSSQRADTLSHFVLCRMWQYHLYWFYSWTVWGAKSCFCIIWRLDRANWSIHCDLTRSVLHGCIISWWKSTYIPWRNKGWHASEMWSTRLLMLFWSKIQNSVFHFVSLICISGLLNSNPSVSLFCFFFHVIYEEFYTSVVYGITLADLEGSGYQYGSFFYFMEQYFK